MYRSLGFYVGYKACALNDVVSGAANAKDLVQERNKFFYAIRLVLNTVQVLC